MSIGSLIFCVIGFAFSIFALISVMRKAEDDPAAAGIAAYVGGVCFVSCIMFGLGIIGFIIKHLA